MKLASIITTLFLIISCSKEMAPISMSPVEAFGMQRNDFAVIIDVREQSEISETASQAIWIPQSEIDADGPKWRNFLSKHPHDKLLAFMCRSGRRAKDVAEKAGKMGYKTSYIGGLVHWKNANLPTTPFQIKESSMGN